MGNISLLNNGKIVNQQDVVRKVTPVYVQMNETLYHAISLLTGLQAIFDGLNTFAFSRGC